MMDCMSVGGSLCFPTEGQCNPSGWGEAGQHFEGEREHKLIVKSVVKLQIFCHSLEETSQ